MRSCLVVTFNSNKTRQTVEQVESYLEEPLRTCNTPPDFLVFSIQEASTILDASFGRVDEWLKPYISAAPPDYKLVAKPTCGAIALLVFRHDTVPIRSFWTKTAPFGIFWSSLKGAVCASLELNNEEGRLTFVGAHLCANEGNKIPRNKDFDTFTDAFDLQDLDGQIIVAGDLNYRSRNGSLRSDELTTEMALSHVALGFKEHAIAFKPTYKYEKNSNTFVKTRSPSWCDRVLYRELGGGSTVNAYSSIQKPNNSDHKPVYLNITTSTSARPISNFLAVAGSSDAPEKLVADQPPVRFITPVVDLGFGAGIYLVATTYGRILFGGILALLLIAYLL